MRGRHQRGLPQSRAIAAAREAGKTSLQQIATYLIESGIVTPRGKQWTATAVSNAQKLISA
jgi:hypothetical protein